MRAPLLALACALPLCACASSPPRADAPSPASGAAASSGARAEASVPPRARLVLDAIEPVFERRLADGATLQVSRSGRRARVSRDGTRELAPDLAPRALFEASTAADGATTFLAVDGELAHAPAPLGPFGARRPLAVDAKGPFVAGSFGAHAALLATADGELVRVLEDGARAERRRLPLRRGDRVVDVAADAKGHAYALILPQRLLASRDDGATWSDLATPGIGARSLAKDADDAVLLEGAEDEWVAMREEPQRFEPAQRPRFTEPSPRALHVERIVAGDRLVTVRDVGPGSGESRRVAISIGSVSAASAGAPAARAITLDGGASVISRVVAGGWGARVVLALTGANGADGAKTRVLSTEDDGKSFVELATLRGSLGPDAVVSVAPGWLSVGPVGDASVGTTLVRRRDENGRRLTGVPHFVADPSRPRLFEFVVKLGSVVGAVAIARPTDTELGDVSRTVDAGEFAAEGIDPNTGALRLATRSSTGELVLQTIPADGGAIAARALPVRGAIALAGDRGLATSGDATWETADGGEHWTAVGAGGPRVRGCNAEGCALDDGVRVGWDLALGSPGGTDALVATARVKPSATSSSAASSNASLRAPTPKLRLACTPGGAWTRSPGQLPEPDDAGLGHDVRFAVAAEDDERSHRVLVAQGSGAPRLVPLGARAPLKSGEVRLATERWNDEGLAAASAIVAPSPNAADGATQLSQLDLAWWSSARGKGSHATIPGPLTIPTRRNRWFAFVAAVDGGAVVLPQRSSRLWFARDDGGVESYVLPGGYRPDEAFRAGGALRLVSGLHATIGDVADVGLIELTKGAGPLAMTWSFGASVGAFAHGGRLWLDVATTDDWTRRSAVLPLDALTVDPPAFTMFAAAPGEGDAAAVGRAPSACSAQSREGARSVDFANDDVGFTAGDLAVRAITRTAPDGSRCVDVIVGSDATTRSIVPLHDLGHGLLLRDAGSNALEHRPLVCVIAK